MLSQRNGMNNLTFIPGPPQRSDTVGFHFTVKCCDSDQMLH